MALPHRRDAVRQVLRRLEELVGEPGAQASRTGRRGGPQVDAVARVGGFTFVIEWKGAAAAATVAAAARQVLENARRADTTAIPLVAVPFMGDVGRQRCAEAGVSWLDLSGNASLAGPGLRVFVEGRPNQFKRRGRPASPFAPKSARIARWLLMHANRAMTQREIARATDMDEGFTSRIVAKLQEEGLVERAPEGQVRASDPGLLLDAWREVYAFSKHRIRRGHVAARSGHDLLMRLGRDLGETGIEYAATGLGAAWLLSRFAAFRIVTFYLREEPAPAILEQASFREDPRGANVWLVLPNDDGVFHGSSVRDGLRCVHPVQVYLDLADHPERAEDAARILRADLLVWKNGG